MCSDTWEIINYCKVPQSLTEFEIMEARIALPMGTLVKECAANLEMLDKYLSCGVFLLNREGSNLTPAHRCRDFRFRTYAPTAFRYFRDLFGIQPDDFLVSS